MRRLIRRENIITFVIGMILAGLLGAGVVLAAQSLSRSINVHVTSTLISVSGDTALDFYFDSAGGSQSETYRVTNTSGTDVEVDATCDFTGAGISVTGNPSFPASFSLAPGNYQDVVVTVTSDGTVTEGSVNIVFTPSQI